ncbi:MAG: hypothetical protein EBU46_07565 [Nitrosomonadaceae bacterium]|nr:hypothetical protein [Nitrosomonadaceae bacterium]
MSAPSALGALTRELERYPCTQSYTMEAAELAILFAAAFAALIIAIAAIASATLRALMACYFPPAPAINKKNRPQFAHL